MSEKLKRIEFKHTEHLTDEDVGRIAGFLTVTTSMHRNSERDRLEEEVYGQGGHFGNWSRRRGLRTEEEFEEDLMKSDEFNKKVDWLDRSIWEGYYDLMGKISHNRARFSMTSVVAGFIGTKPVMLEQHWGTEDLDQPGRDETEFQYLILDKEVWGNLPLLEEVKSHLGFVAEMDGVSDGEIPSIQTFGTLDYEQLRDILPT